MIPPIRSAFTRLGPLCGVLAVATLAACTQAPPPSAAQAADLAACTRQADAAYQNATVDQLSRTSTYGQRFSGQPTQIFRDERLGAEHVRDDQITACMNNGNGNIRGLSAAPLPQPRIITPSDSNSPANNATGANQ